MLGDVACRGLEDAIRRGGSHRVVEATTATAANDRPTDRPTDGRKEMGFAGYDSRSFRSSASDLRPVEKWLFYRCSRLAKEIARGF